MFRCNCTDCGNTYGPRYPGESAQELETHERSMLPRHCGKLSRAKQLAFYDDNSIQVNQSPWHLNETIALFVIQQWVGSANIGLLYDYWSVLQEFYYQYLELRTKSPKAITMKVKHMGDMKCLYHQH